MILLATVAIVIHLPLITSECLTVAAQGRDRSVSVCISDNTGEIQSIVGQISDKAINHTVLGTTRLDGCTTDENGISIEHVDQESVVVNRTMTCHSNYWHQDNNRRAFVSETFTASHETVSISWTVLVESPDTTFWTTAIDTAVIWNDFTTSLFWTGGPLNELAINETYNPLDPIKLPTDPYTYFRYGGQQTDIREPKAIVAPSMAIPVATRINPEEDTGVSILFSPEDTPVYSVLNAYAVGANQEMGVFNYSRQYHRLGNNSEAVIFTQDIAVHEGCWRSSLAWMAEQYKEYFEPYSGVDAYSLNGAGAYADYIGFELNSTKLKLMDFTVNWDATFPYPYHGMWLPFSPFYTSPWVTCFPHDLQNGTWQPCINLTYEIVNSYYQKLKSIGSHSLTYANLFEYGLDIVELNTTLDCPANATNQTKIKCDSNRFLREFFESAILRDRTTDKMIYGGVGNSIIMDPGTEAYLSHILNMAKTILTETPDSEGIAIDRQDWIGYVNPHGDDGRTWLSTPDIRGAPVRAMIFSWKDTMSQLATTMHSANKAIFINDHTYRLDMMKNVDGFYDEFGDNNAKMMVTSLLSLGGKPAVAWNHDTTTNLDNFLQRHLFWGINPTVPFPDNDHCINPSPQLDSVYEDYGPLFEALRGKRWVLEPHAVSIANNSAQANVFWVRSGLAVSVVFGNGKIQEVQVKLSVREIQSRPKKVTVMYPGSSSEYIVDKVNFDGGILAITVKLQRGCAHVQVYMAI